MTTVIQPFPFFADLGGDPLDEGYIYIGLPNQNPETSPKQAYWDAALTIPATQPLRTLEGYIARNGAPARVFVNGEFSMTVRNKRGSLVYTLPAVDSFVTSADLALPGAAATLGVNGRGYYTNQQDASDWALWRTFQTSSLLSVLTDAERADVLAGTNAIDITAKITAWIAAARPNTLLDATCLRGTVTLTADLFAGIFSAPVVLMTGQVVFKQNFNTVSSIYTPSYLTWVWDKTEVRPSVPINAIPSVGSPVHAMVATKLVSITSISGTSGSNVITVSSANGIFPQGVIAVPGIVEEPNLAFTLTSNITSSTTSIALTGSTTNTIDGSAGYIKIGSEIIAGTIAGGVMTATQRGALGTTAASATAGAAVVFMKAFSSRVLSVSGLNVTLVDNAPRTFAGAYGFVGAVRNRLVGTGIIDGEYSTAASPQPPGIFQAWGSVLGSECRIDSRISLRNCNHGGAMLYASRNCDVNVDVISGVGKPADGIGASVWVFGGAFRNTVGARVVSNGNITAAIDNKSAGVPYIGMIDPCLENVVDFGEAVDHLYGFDIACSSRNTCRVGYQRTTASPVGLYGSGGQLVTDILPVDNVVIIGHDANLLKFGGNGQAGNTVVMNGIAGRRRTVSTDLVGNVFVSAGTFSVVSFVLSTGGGTLENIEPGDSIQCVPSTAWPSGIFVDAECTAQNTITIRLYNSTGGTVNANPATKTLTFICNGRLL